MLGLHLNHLHTIFGGLNGAEEGCEIKEEKEELHVPGWDGLGEASVEQRHIKIEVVHKIKSGIENYPSLKWLENAFDDCLDQIKIVLELTVGRSEDVTVGEYIDRITLLREVR